MYDNYMQIEINETLLNCKTSYDNILEMKVFNNHLFIKDINDWSTNIEINEKVVVTVNFYNYDEEDYNY